MRRFEDRYGVLFTGFVLSVCLVVFSLAYSSARFSVVDEHGRIYAAMSSQPFDLTKPNALEYRILTPLLAHLVFLRGDLYYLFPMLMSVLFLTAVYYYLRQRLQLDIIRSFLVTVMLSTSAALYVTFHWPGRVDETSYLLIVLCMIFIDRKIWFVFLALAILNHPANLFIAPPLVLLSFQHSERLSVSAVFKTAPYLAVSIVPFLAWRGYANARVMVGYDYTYYFSLDILVQTLRHNWPYLAIGMFMTFKFLWYVPLRALIDRIQHRDWYPAALLSTTLVCVALQLLIAEDITRMMSLAFIAVLLGIPFLIDRCSTKWFWVMTGLNILLPILYVTGSELVLIRPFWL